MYNYLMWTLGYEHGWDDAEDDVWCPGTFQYMYLQGYTAAQEDYDDYYWP